MRVHTLCPFDSAREAVCPLFDFCASQFRPRWGAICSSGHKENIFAVQRIGFGGEPDLSAEPAENRAGGWGWGCAKRDSKQRRCPGQGRGQKR